MKTKERMRWAAGLMLLAGIHGAQADVGLIVGNVAPPAAGDRRAQIVIANDPVHDLPYKGFSGPFRVPAGRTHVVARDGSQVLTERDLDLHDGYQYVLMLMGDGASHPFKLGLATDHDRPLVANGAPDGLHVMQTANVAPADDRYPRGLVVFRDCGSEPPRTLPNSGMDYGRGTDLAPDSFDSGILSAATCYGYVFDPRNPSEPLSKITYTPETGGRYRLFAVGNGSSQPIEALLLKEAIDPILPFVTVTPEMEGLWYDPRPEFAGTGLSISIDPSAPKDHRITGLLYGYQHRELFGRSEFGDHAPARWSLVEVHDAHDFEPAHFAYFYDYRGGNSDDTRPSTRVPTGQALIYFHSCNRATLEVMADFGSSLVVDPPPRDVLHLQRLLPQGTDCATSTAD